MQGGSPRSWREAIWRPSVAAAVGVALVALTLAGSAAGAPANDSFAAAQALSGATGTVAASNAGAGREPGEPVPDPAASGKTVWFTWQATFSGPASVDTRGSDFDTVLAVYTGTRIDRLTWVAGNDIDFWVGSARAQFTATAGTVYRIQVDGMRGESGAISLTWNRPRPPNDDFAAAQTIAGESGTVTGTNLLATAEPGEPSDYGQGHSIWYRWTAPATALYEFDATTITRPTYLIAYTGSTPTTLVRRAVNSDSLNPRVRLAATAGVTYVVELDSASFQNTGPTRIDWRRLPAPPNDAFASFQRLDWRPATVAGDVWGATAEPGEPAHAGAPAHASVWYRWRAPATTWVNLTIDDNAFYCGAAVYTGSALTGLTPVVSKSDYFDCDLSLDAVAGTDYAIAVNGESDSGGPFSLRLYYPPPPNDTFALAETVFQGETLVEGRNALATKEPGEPQHGPRPGGASVWYAWGGPTPGTVTVDTMGSTFDTLLAAYTGTVVSSLVPVAADDDSAGGGASRISFHVDGSSAYRVAVDGVNGAVGDIRLNWSFAPDPPSNDDFADAQRISLEKNFVHGRTTSASRETGEPAHAGVVQGGHSVWYRWTAPADGLAVFDTYDVDSSGYFPDTTFDTLLAVYRGSSLGSLVPVAANDDHGFWYVSRVSFLVAAGDEYVIAIDGDGGAQGSFALNWTIAPPNDDFDRPQVLSGAEGYLTSTTLFSTWEGYDGGDPSDRDEPANVWHRWRAPASGPVELVLESSSDYTWLGVYTGPTYATLHWVETVGTRTGRFLSVKFQARAGTVYRFEVVGDSWGAFTLAWHPTTIPPPPVVPKPPNDDFANAQPLAGESGSVTGSNERATNEPGEPLHSDEDDGDYSVWYRWTAPYSGTAELDTVGSDFTTVLAVHTGTAVDRLSRVTYGAGTQVTRLGVTAGTTYAIAVSGAWRYDPLGNLVLRWRRSTTAPANDSLAGAATLTGTSGTLDLSNAGASAEALEPRHAGLRPFASVWFRWTAPASGAVSFQTSTSSVEGRLAAYTGTALGSLVRVAANNESVAGGAEARIVFTAQAGTTYAIAFDVNWTPGGASLSWRMPPAPPNDAWGAAAPLPQSWYTINRFLVDSGDNFGATTEAAEPVHGGVAGSAATVWYRLVWDYGTQPFVLDSVGSTFDTVLAVYTGSSLGALTPVASDDDSAGGGLSRLTFTAVGSSSSPTTYWIAVAGKGGATGKIALELSPTGTPPNDHFHAATPLVGPSGSITGSVHRASVQHGEPVPTGFGSDGSIWYRWTAPVSGTWVFDFAGTQFDGRYGVYAGDRVGDLLELAAADTGPLFVPVVAGATYSILINGDSRSTGAARLAWRQATVAAHDRFSAALTLAGATGSVTYSNREASVEPGEPLHADVVGGASLWYRWTAPFTGTVAIDTAGSTASDLVLAAYTGGSLLDLREAAANDDFAGELVPSLRFEALAGTTYVLAVDGSSWSTEYVPRGDVRLNWQLAVPPANDRFASAGVLAGESGSASGTTVGARIEPGEPEHADRAAGASVWYAWTAPAAGNYRFDVSASGFPALLGIYTGGSVGALSVVRRSDDLGARLDAVTFAATAGTTYRLAIDGLVRATGPVSLSWSRVGPANDAFAAAAEVHGRLGTTLAATRGATAEPGEPAHAGAAAAASVWYRWRAPATEVVTFDTHGSDFDTRLAVYTGTGLGGLTPGGRRDASLKTDAVRLEASEGTLYWIAVDGAAGATGNAVLNWSPTPAPPNDHLADARLIGGREGTLPQTSFPATREAGEPDHAAAGGRRSVWFRFKAATTGSLTVSALYPAYDTAIAAYTGSAVTGLTLVAQDTGGAGLYGGYRQSRATFAVTPGREYQIAVDGVAGQAGDFTLVWRLPPQNDAFAAAQPISGDAGTVEGTTLGAGSEAGESEPGFVQEQSVWYRWTAPVSGTYLFDLAGSEAEDVGLAFYAGETLASLRAGGHWRDPGRTGVVAGTTYRIQVAAARPAGNIRLNWRRTTDAPANDNLAAASVLSGQSGVASGTNVGSSREPGEPQHGEQGYTVWFAWTAPATGKLQVWTNGSTYDSKVVVYTGTAVGSLTKVEGYYSTTGGSPSTSFANVPVTAGTTYRIAHDGVFTGSYSLNWLFDGTSPDSGTSNDMFGAAHVLTGPGGVTSGTNVGATKEAGEPNHAGNAGGKSVWYSWRAPAGGTTMIETTGCGLDTLIGVYTGSTVGALATVASNDDVTQTCPASRVSFAAVAGTIYRIAVDGWNGAAGSFQLSWSGQSADVEPPWTQILSGPAGTVSSRSASFTFNAHEPATFECRLDGAPFSACTSPATYTGLAPGPHTFHVRARDTAGNVDPTPEQRSWTIAAAPANDAFAAAQALAGLRGEALGSVFGATTEPGEPAHAGLASDRSVWYRWTAPRDGIARFETGASSIWETRVGVYTGSAVGALTPVGRIVAPGASPRSDSVTFRSVAGTTYSIAVAGTTNGEFRLDWSAAPLNDARRDAAALVGASGSWRGDNVGATLEPDEPAHGGRRLGGSSIWLRWTAPLNGRLVVDTVGSDPSLDTLLAVYTASPYARWWEGDLILRAGDDDSAGGGKSRVELEVFAGTVYLIAVDGFAGTSGELTVQWRFGGDMQATPPTVSLRQPAANSLVSGRVALSASAYALSGIAYVSFSVNGSVVGADWSAPYTFDWDSTTVPNGPATIVAFAHDFSSGVAGTPPRTVQVVNAP